MKFSSAPLQLTSLTLHHVQLHKKKKKVGYSARINRILKRSHLCGKPIPKSHLENANDAYETAEILKSHYSTDATEVLSKALEKIPRKDLAEQLHDKIKAGKVNECEGPNDEMDSKPPKRAKYDELEPYLGAYRLSDLMNYARNNQEQLIKQLEKQLEPSALNKLKEQLSWSKVKNNFLFNADQCYQLFTNQALKKFLEEVPLKKKFQVLPKKILEILFFKIKHKKVSAKDKKQSKDYLTSVHSQPRENQQNILSPAASNGEMELDDQREELLANEVNERIRSSSAVIDVEDGNIDHMATESEQNLEIQGDAGAENESCGSGGDMQQSLEVQGDAGAENESCGSGGDMQQNLEIQGDAGAENESCGSGGDMQQNLEIQGDAGAENESCGSGGDMQQNLEIQGDAGAENESCGSGGDMQQNLEIQGDAGAENESCGSGGDMQQNLEIQGDAGAENESYGSGGDMQQNLEIQGDAGAENESCGSGGDMQQNLEIQGDAGAENESYESGGDMQRYMQTSCNMQKTVPEKQPEEDLKMAFINWCKIKRESHQARDHVTFDAISVHEHKTYNCLIASNVFCFKLQEEEDYCLLRVLHGEEDLGKRGYRGKKLKFELQFNMAVLDAQRCIVVSSTSNFFRELQPDRSFNTFETFFLRVVNEIVLPDLALYRWVKTDIAQKAYDQAFSEQSVLKKSHRKYILEVLAK